jgi:hypothetical protein
MSKPIDVSPAQAAGLTVGDDPFDHPTTMLRFKDDEERDIKAGIARATSTTDIRSGLTTGDPAENHARQVREAEMIQHGNAVNAADNFDRAELQMYRDQARYDELSNRLNNAENSDEDNMDVVLAMTPAERERWVQDSWDPQAAHEWMLQAVAYIPTHQEQIAEAKTEVGRLQDTLTKARIVQGIADQRGMTDEQREQWYAGVQSRAAREGIDLNSMRPDDFLANLQASEVAIAEDHRAAAVARMKQNIFDSDTTDVGSGLEVLGANGWQHKQPQFEAEARPDYSGAADRVFGSDNDPARQSNDDIKRGIILAETSVGESREWKRVQALAAEQKTITIDGETMPVSVARKLGLSR